MCNCTQGGVLLRMSATKRIINNGVYNLDYKTQVASRKKKKPGRRVVVTAQNGESIALRVFKRRRHCSAVVEICIKCLKYPVFNPNTKACRACNSY